MNIFLFIFLSLFFNTQLSQGAIEIYSAGKRFDSFEDYKKPVTDSAPQTKQTDSILDSGQQRLDKISYNSGVSHMMTNFVQGWKSPRPRFIVDSDELQYTIQEAMQNQQQPILLISDPDKLRIMSYSNQDNMLLKGQMQKVDKSSNK